MSIDATMVRAIVHSSQHLVGASLTKIQQPDPLTLHLTFRTASGFVKYALSVHPETPLFIPIQKKTEYPVPPPAFCMLLRKHCENGVITRIAQPNMERIVFIDFLHREPWDDVGTPIRWVIEWMGKHSNLIVVQHDIVLDACKRITGAISRHRLLVPGAKFTSPPMLDRIDPLLCSGATFATWALQQPSPVAPHMVRTYCGMSPLLAQEIEHRALHIDTADRHTAWNVAWETLWSPLRRHEYTPTVTTTEQKTFVTVFVPKHLNGTVQSCASIAEAILHAQAKRPLVSSLHASLRTWLRTEIAKKTKKAHHLQEALHAAADADHDRICGMLLHAHQHTIERGLPHVTVTNYFEESLPDVIIRLDVRLSPRENIDRYFQRYQKKRDSIAMITEQCADCHEDIAYLTSISHQLTEATTDEVTDILIELQQTGYDIQRLLPKTSRRRDRSVSFVGYRTPSGAHIYYGRNNRQNEELTHRFARANDTWLHVRHMPGPHVLVRLPSHSMKTIDSETLELAAHVAVWHSSARHSSKVPVDYTAVKNVKKPAKAKPGQVLYDPYETVLITPDETMIARLEPLHPHSPTP